MAKHTAAHTRFSFRFLAPTPTPLGIQFPHQQHPRIQQWRHSTHNTLPPFNPSPSRCVCVDMACLFMSVSASER
jgi:hypothetical protein